jgi:drug/metabolite transporter (DMT)-like permease
VILPSSAAVYWSVGFATNQLHLAMPLPAFLAVGSATVAGALGSFLVLLGLQVTPAARTAALGMLEPVVAVVLSIVLLGDLMTWLRGLGIAIVVTGIGLLHVRSARRS